MSNITITKVKKSSLTKVDFANIPFGKIFTDHMYVVDYEDGKWQAPEIKPMQEYLVHPGNMAWHYGQSIFEGMKATIDSDGVPLLFRPEEHIIRLNKSARRMCMPEMSHEMFLDAVHTIVSLEKSWIPPAEGSALYVRPFMYANDHSIGVKASESYRFIILCLPVGPYYSTPVKLKATDQYIRAAVGGVGEAKTAGNYAASLYPAKLAKEMGYDQIMWLDAKEHKYIQEVGTMNIFFVIDGKVITPSTDGAILKGITRKSVIHILKDRGYTVEERPISIDEVMDASKNGTLTEVFGSGTAAVISNVIEINYKVDVAALKESDFDISLMLKNFLNKMRIGEIEDPYGWVVPAKSAVNI